MPSATRIRFVGSLALAIALVQVAVYVTWRLSDGTLGWFLLDPRLGISAWTDSTGVPGVAAWLSVPPLALAGLALRRSPSPFTLKAYMGIESALAAPSVAFFALVMYENLGSAHGFSIRELPIPLTVLLLVTVVPLSLAWRALRMVPEDPLRSESDPAGRRG